MERPTRPTRTTVAQTPSRVIILGASNVALGFSVLIDAVRAVVPPPVEIFTAFGHGRSYGMTTRVLARSISGIRDCGIWEALRQRPGAPTRALVTDVGNDLAYGVAPELLLEWIDEVIARLDGAPTIVTGLPRESVAAMSPWTFLAVRSVLFPGRRFSLESIVESSREVDESLAACAGARGFEFVRPRLEWYGFDPIHIRRARRREAWRELLASWREDDAPDAALEAAPPARRDAARLVNVAPERRLVFAREEYEPQPCVRLSDGSTIWAY